MSVTRPGLRIAFALAGAAALFAAQSASAAACWQPATIGAARLNEFRTLMLVVTLRCKAGGIDFRPSYESFLARHAEEIGRAQQQLAAHFGADRTREGRLVMDRYLTSIANSYGSGRSDRMACGSFEAIANELSRPAVGPDMLETLALEMVRDPQLDAPRCPRTQAR